MKKFVYLIVLLLVLFSVPNKAIFVQGHDSDLGVASFEGLTYDECDHSHYVDSNNIGDGINEKWFSLANRKIGGITTFFGHVDHSYKTIYYSFESQYDATNDEVIPTDHNWGVYEQIMKEAIESGIAKWNNIYFYKLNDNNVYEKYKVANFINYDKLENKYDIKPNIYFMPEELDDSVVGSTQMINDTVTDFPTSNGQLMHAHFQAYTIKINTQLSLTTTNNTIEHIFDYVGDSQSVYDFLAKVTAHEIGHIFGLEDIDTIEINSMNLPSDTSEEEICELIHHEEILMGYTRLPVTFNSNSATLNDVGQKNVTYKDLAGVAITRGFHTNDDHMWMRQSVSAGNKLICSICNLIKIVLDDELDSYEYVEYGSCQSNHQLSDGNMIPVASYGNKDYYKCKYCRYVAPFESLINQSYTLISGQFNTTHHVVQNNISGFNYYANVLHNKLSIYLNNIYHRSNCVCGYVRNESHTVSYDDANDGDGYAKCLGCNRLLDLSIDIAIPTSNTVNIKYSINGSYILPSGIIVLVEEDIVSYLEGKLVFYNHNELLSIS